MKVFNFENWVKISSKITNNCANSILWAKLLYFSFLSKLLEKSSRTVGEPLYVYDEIFLSWKRESNLSKISFFFGVNFHTLFWFTMHFQLSKCG